jgi:outer membrane protein OmpA-like peptidoglycan-associated protein
MSTSVIEILKGLVSPSLINTVGPAIGLPTEIAGRGLNDMVGQYLGALVQQSGDSNLMSSIADMANSVTRDASGLGDIKGMLAGGVPATTAVLAGNRLMGSLFGVWQASVVHKIADALGIKPEASSSLFNLAAPMVLSAIAKRLGGGALTGAALAGLIGQERGALLGGLASAASGLVSSAAAAVPPPVAAVATAAARPAAAAAAAAAPVAAAASPRDNGLFTSFLWLLLPLAFIGWLAWQKMNEGAADAPPPPPPAAEVSEPAPAPVAAAPAPEPAPAEAPAPAAAPVLADGQSIFSLAGGKEITAASNGVESKLLAFINDANASIDKNIWFDFDRLNFETGSSMLTSESKAQVINIVEILNAYPAVKIKIGGYTDNVGNPENNLSLSDTRAKAVMEAITSSGIAADRIEAEGYGEQYPVGDNATPEGRAQNRRTAVSVRAK